MNTVNFACFITLLLIAHIPATYTEDDYGRIHMTLDEATYVATVYMIFGETSLYNKLSLGPLVTNDYIAIYDEQGNNITESGKFQVQDEEGSTPYGSRGIKYINDTSMKIILKLKQKLNNMQYLFSLSTGVSEISFENFQTDSMTSLNGVFNSCSRIKSLDLTSFNVDSVTYIGDLFANCQSLEKIKLPFFNKVTNIYGFIANTINLYYLDTTVFNASIISSTSYAYYRGGDTSGIKVIFYNDEIVKSWKSQYSKTPLFEKFLEHPSSESDNGYSFSELTEKKTIVGTKNNNGDVVIYHPLKTDYENSEISASNLIYYPVNDNVMFINNTIYEIKYDLWVEVENTNFETFKNEFSETKTELSETMTELSETKTELSKTKTELSEKESDLDTCKANLNSTNLDSTDSINMIKTKIILLALDCILLLLF